MREWLVLYDADCGFCVWALALLLRWDRRERLAPLALGTAAADQALADLPPPERSASWHLVSPQGVRTSAGAALAPALALLPGGSVPAALLRRAPDLTERAYAWVAGNRSSLSRFVPRRAKRRAADRVVARSRLRP